MVVSIGLAAEAAVIRIAIPVAAPPRDDQGPPQHAGRSRLRSVAAYWLSAAS
jgi:hypothetical protein